MTKRAHKIFRDYVASVGLRLTKQRSIIASAFLSHKGHLTAEQLLKKVNELERGISLATVYRTMKLLEESGLVVVHRFSDEHALFEPRHGQEAHHDHLICVKCGAIVEFTDPRILKRQKEIASYHGFTDVTHKFELYGKCATCSE